MVKDSAKAVKDALARCALKGSSGTSGSGNSRVPGGGQLLPAGINVTAARFTTRGRKAASAAIPSKYPALNLQWTAEFCMPTLTTTQWEQAIADKLIFGDVPFAVSTNWAAVAAKQDKVLATAVDDCKRRCNCVEFHTKGRGQIPWEDSAQSSVYARLSQELSQIPKMLSVENVDAKAPSMTADLKYREKLSKPYVFQFAAGHENIGLEHMGMASVRLQLEGTRTVLLFYSPQAVKKIESGAAEALDIDRIFAGIEKLTEADIDSMVREDATSVKIGQVRPGEWMFVPAGWIVVDRVMDEKPSVGLRKAVIVPDLYGIAALETVIGCAARAKKATAPMEEVANLSKVVLAKGPEMLNGVLAAVAAAGDNYTFLCCL